MICPVSESVRSRQRFRYYPRWACSVCLLYTSIAIQEGYVTVDPDNCIACGECFDVCPHEARDYYEDTDLLDVYKRQAQYDSELVYHNVKDEVAAQGVVYTCLLYTSRCV